MRVPRLLHRRPDIAEIERRAIVDAYHTEGSKDPVGILRRRLEDSIAIRLRLARNQRWLTIVCFVGVALTLWALYGVVRQGTHDHERLRETHALAVENRSLIMRVESLALQVRAQRRASIELTCRQENKRHDEVLAGFAAFAQRNPNPGKPPPKPGTSEYKRQQRVLDEFVGIGWPRRDCAKRLAELTSTTATSHSSPRPPPAHVGHVRGIGGT